MTIPGTYTGAVGRTCYGCSHWRESATVGVGECHAAAPKASYCDPDIDDNDIPGYGMVMWIKTSRFDWCGQFAAKAALDALVEAEEEWVTWKEHGTGNTFRIKRDGSGQIERVCKNLNNGTTDVTYPCSMVTYAEDAYRKGREVALEEAQKELDAKTREITALRDVCASINILMQERGMEGMGGKNYALLFGVVQTYIHQLEAPLEESADLRDAARKLVEAVNSRPIFNHVDCWGWLKEIGDAAKILEGKLLASGKDV